MSFNYSIGRSSLNDICLSDKTVSSFHARIYLGNDGFMWIEDLDSTNGTYINGFKTSGKSKIKPGDRLCLGAFEFDWMSQVMSRQTSAAGAAPIQAEGTNNVTNYKPKKNYFIQYTIVLILGIIVLSTVLIGVNFSKWGSGSQGKEKIAKNDDNNEASEKKKAGKKDNEDNEDNDEQNDSKPSSDSENKGTGNGQKKPKSETKHDLSCLRNQDPISETIGKGREIEDIFMKNAEVDVSVEEEISVGEQVKKSILAKSSLLNDSRYVNRIDRIMKKLLAELDNPKFNYKWYVLDDNTINAMTSGGNIFIYKGIIDFADDDDELAAILAHEIYHNELGHIKDHIKKEKISRGIFGEFSQIPLIAATVITMPNNQYNEANCDLYGIDLCERAGYNGCHAQKLWERMKQREGNRSPVEKLFSTHPFSKDRANCIHHHMKNNYNKTCSH
jgi:hypothetical protein